MMYFEKHLAGLTRTCAGPALERQRPVLRVRPPPNPLFFHCNTRSRRYFNGDTGEGIGASHQTGWTALVASLIGEPQDETVTGAGSRRRASVSVQAAP